MGWFRNVFKSLGDVGGETSQEEATEEEVAEFLKKAGASPSTRVSKLEKDLERDKLLHKLKSGKVDNIGQRQGNMERAKENQEVDREKTSTGEER